MALPGLGMSNGGPPAPGGDLGGGMDPAEDMYQQAMAMATDEQIWQWTFQQLEMLRSRQGGGGPAGASPTGDPWMDTAMSLGI